MATATANTVDTFISKAVKSFHPGKRSTCKIEVNAGFISIINFDFNWEMTICCEHAIPVGEYSKEQFALAMLKSRMVLFSMILVPFVEAMPLTNPVVPIVALVLALVRFAMVLPLMVTVPVPKF